VKDIMGLMDQARQMQAKMEAMQADLAEMEAEGLSGGGLVKVTLNGKGFMTALSIDPSLIKDDEGDIIDTMTQKTKLTG